MLRILLLALPIVLLVGAIAIIAHHGGFTRVRVTESERGPFLLVYREVATSRNLFKETEAITTALDVELTRAGIDDRMPFDVFYPAGSPHAADIGFVVPESAAGQLLQVDAPTRRIPADLFMVAEFPWRSPLSFLVGHVRVDPAFAAHRQRNRYEGTPAIALNTGETIVYMQPIQRAAP